MQADAIFKAVADPNRLKIISLLSSGPKVVEELAVELNISVSTAFFHLEKLKAASLVSDEKVQYYRRYSLNRDLLDKSIMEIIVAGSAGGDCRRFNEAAVGECFKDGKLIKLPVQRFKRQAVLEEAAKVLESKRGLTEREVDIRLSEIYEDFIVLRKEMLAFGMIEKTESGKYIRNKNH